MHLWNMHTKATAYKKLIVNTFHERYTIIFVFYVVRSPQ